MKKKIVGIFVITLLIPLLGINATANDPPSAPTVDGPTEGKANVIYKFTFCATDPDNDDIRYFVEWDDLSSEWTPCEYSGVTVTLEHMYSDPGVYTIRAIAEECIPNGVTGPEGTHTITIGKSKQYLNIPFIQFFQNILTVHPNLFPILRQLLLLKL